LGWPLDQIRITQLFGDTDFARSHPGAYNGKGHNGVDFAAKHRDKSFGCGKMAW